MSRFYNLDEEKRRNPLARLNLPQGYDVTNIRSDMVAREQPDPMVGRLSAAGVNNPYGNDPVVGSEALMGLGDTSRAYQLAATRGDKRISDTKRRVSELVKLDPTNPLALLVTMLGAREEALTTEELNKLRGIDKKSTRSKLKREKFIKDLKLAGNEKYFEAVVQDKFNGDVDAAINDPKIREKIVAQRSKPEKLKGQALSDFATSYQRLSETYENVKAGLSDGDAKLMGHVVKRMQSYLIAQLSDGASEDNIEFMNQAYGKLVQQKYEQTAELESLLALPSPTKEQQKRIKQLSPPSQPTKKGAGGAVAEIKKKITGKKEGAFETFKNADKTLSNLKPEELEPMADQSAGASDAEIHRQRVKEYFASASTDRGWQGGPIPDWALRLIGGGKGPVTREDIKKIDEFRMMQEGASRGRGGKWVPDTRSYTYPQSFDYMTGEMIIPDTRISTTEQFRDEEGNPVVSVEPEFQKEEGRLTPKVEGGSVSTYKSPLLVEELGLGADLTGTDATGSYDIIPKGFFSYSGGEHKEEYQEWLNKSEKERIAIVNQLKTNPKLSDVEQMVKTISEAVILKESTGEDAAEEKELLDNIIMHLPTGSEKDILSTLRTAEQLPREDIRADVPYSQGYKYGIPALSAGTGAFDKIQNSLRNLMPEQGMEDFDPMAKPSWLKDTGDTMIVPLDTPVKKAAWKKVVNDFMTITKKSTNVDKRDIGKDKRKADKLQKQMRDVNKKTPTKKLDKKSWDTKLGEDIIGGFESIFGKDMVVPSKGGIQSERDKRADIGSTQLEQEGEDQLAVGMGGPVTFDIESETDESVKFLAKTENEPLDPNAIGYKVVPKVVDGKKVKKADGRTTMVYAKDKKGEKIPVSFGLMQLTVKTASGTKYGRRLFNKKKANTMDEKIDLLMNPKHNVAIGKEFKNTLKRKIKERLSKIGKKWSEQDIETATIAAYNWNGENFPSVIERTKANNLNQLLQKWDAREDQFVPEETKNHIRRYREMRGW